MNAVPSTSLRGRDALSFALRRPKRLPCSVEGCSRISAARGLCQVHYERQRHGLPVNAPIIERRPQKGRTCSVEGCGKDCKAKDLCETHYKQLLRGRS